MSVLTKVFIVFHVVLSLLLAAGLIVFVNRVENFRTANDTAMKSAQSANALANQLKAEASAAQVEGDKARKERDDAVTALASAKEEPLATIAGLNGKIADLESANKILTVTLDNATAATNNSEAQRKAQADILASTRTTNDDLSKKNSDLNLTISDLTNKLDVAQRKVTEFTEMYAEARSDNDRLNKIIKDAGIKGGTGDSMTAGLMGGAPRINAVVRATSDVNGIPHATISVGSDDDVKVGMRFFVIDRKGTDGFLGEMVIDAVDAKQATGRLEGPNVPGIKVGVEARTQLN